jgi:D-alanine-D-alanine ligase
VIVGLTYDLRNVYVPYPGAPVNGYAEFDSEETIRCLELTIQGLSHQVRRIGNVWDLVRFLAEGNLADIVFNIAEGMWGRAREAQIPAILEAFRVPYTFSDPLTMSLCLDKAMAKRLWRCEGILTPDFCVVSDMSEVDEAVRSLPAFPLFVKPAHEGTSKGVGMASIVASVRQLSERIEWVLDCYQQPALIEEYLPGREFTVGVLGAGHTTRVVGVAEVRILDPSERVYGFLQKEECETRVSYGLVGLPRLENELSELALRAYVAVGCQDAGRVDIRLDSDGKPHVLEINPLPGLHPTHSDLPIIASQKGISYQELIADILQNAIERWSLQNAAY